MRSTRFSDKVINAISYSTSAFILGYPVYYYFSTKLPSSRSHFEGVLGDVLVEGKRWGASFPWKEYPIYARKQDIKLKQMLLYIEDKTKKCREEEFKKCVSNELNSKENNKGGSNKFVSYLEKFFKDIYDVGDRNEVVQYLFLDDIEPRAAPLIDTVFSNDVSSDCSEGAFQNILIDFSKRRLRRKLGDITHMITCLENKCITWSIVDNYFTGMFSFFVDQDIYAALKIERENNVKHLMKMAVIAEVEMKQVLEEWKDPSSFSSTSKASSTTLSKYETRLQSLRVKGAWEKYRATVLALDDFNSFQSEIIRYLDGEIEEDRYVTLFNLLIWGHHLQILDKASSFDIHDEFPNLDK